MQKHSSRKIYSLEEMAEGIKRLDTDFGSQELSAKNKDDPKRLREVRIKRGLLRRLQGESRELMGFEKNLFLSFPERLLEDAENVRKLAKEKFGFKNVYTGFDPDVRTARTLRTGIMYAIRESSCLLGVWSDDIIVRPPDSQQEYSGPGVWMPIELGMALAMEKPIRLLIKVGLHDKFITPVSDFPHFPFKDQRTFDQMAAEALSVLSASVELIEGTRVGAD